AAGEALALGALAWLKPLLLEGLTGLLELRRRQVGEEREARKLGFDVDLAHVRNSITAVDQKVIRRGRAAQIGRTGRLGDTLEAGLRERAVAGGRLGPQVV